MFLNKTNLDTAVDVSKPWEHLTCVTPMSQSPLCLSGFLLPPAPCLGLVIPAEISRSCLWSWWTLIATVVGDSSSKNWALASSDQLCLAWALTAEEWPQNDLRTGTTQWWPEELLGRVDFDNIQLPAAALLAEDWLCWAQFSALGTFCSDFGTLTKVLGAVATLAGSCRAGVWWWVTDVPVPPAGQTCNGRRCTFFSIEGELASVFCL